VYTPHGVLFRKFGAKGEAARRRLRRPKIIGYHAMMRDFRASIAAAGAGFSAGDGIMLMQMIEAIYKARQVERAWRFGWNDRPARPSARVQARRRDKSAECAGKLSSSERRNRSIPTA